MLSYLRLKQINPTIGFMMEKCAVINEKTVLNFGTNISEIVIEKDSTRNTTPPCRPNFDLIFFGVQYNQIILQKQSKVETRYCLSNKIARFQLGFGSLLSLMHENKMMLTSTMLMTIASSWVSGSSLLAGIIRLPFLCLLFKFFLYLFSRFCWRFNVNNRRKFWNLCFIG